MVVNSLNVSCIVFLFFYIVYCIILCIVRFVYSEKEIQKICIHVLIYLKYELKGNI